MKKQALTGFIPGKKTKKKRYTRVNYNIYGREVNFQTNASLIKTFENLNQRINHARNKTEPIRNT
jgi:hypothetical protein